MLQCLGSVSLCHCSLLLTSGCGCATGLDVRVRSFLGTARLRKPSEYGQVATPWQPVQFIAGGPVSLGRCCRCCCLLLLALVDQIVGERDELGIHSAPEGQIGTPAEDPTGSHLQKQIP
jgi:hypothetical protein